MMKLVKGKLPLENRMNLFIGNRAAVVNSSTGEKKTKSELVFQGRHIETGFSPRRDLWSLVVIFGKPMGRILSISNKISNK